MSSTDVSSSSSAPVDWEEKYASLKSKSILFASETKLRLSESSARVLELEGVVAEKDDAVLQLKNKTKTFVQEQRKKQAELETEIKNLKEEAAASPRPQDAASSSSSTSSSSSSDVVQVQNGKLKDRVSFLERETDVLQKQSLSDLSNLSRQYDSEKQGLLARIGKTELQLQACQAAQQGGGADSSSSSAASAASAAELASLRQEMLSFVSQKARLQSDKFALEEKLESLTLADGRRLEAEGQVSLLAARGKELEAQVKSLEAKVGEADKTRASERSAADKKDKETRREMSAKNEELAKERDSQLTDANDEKGELESKVKLLEGKLAATGTMLAEESSKVSALSSERAQALASLADLERLKKKVNELEKKEASNLARLNDAVKRERQHQHEKEEAQVALQHESDFAKEKEECVEQMKEEVKRFANLFEEEERMKKEAEDEVAKNAAVTKDMKKSMKTMIEKLNGEIAGMKMERDDANQKVANLEGYSKRVKELNTEIEVEKARSNNAEARMRQLIEKDHKRDGEVKRLKDECIDHVNKRNAAKVEIQGMIKAIETERTTIKAMNEAIKVNLIPKCAKANREVEAAVQALMADVEKVRVKLNAKATAAGAQGGGDDHQLPGSELTKRRLPIMNKNEPLSTADNELDKLNSGLARIGVAAKNLADIADEHESGGCVQSFMNMVGLNNFGFGGNDDYDYDDDDEEDDDEDDDEDDEEDKFEEEDDRRKGKKGKFQKMDDEDGNGETPTKQSVLDGPRAAAASKKRVAGGGDDEAQFE